MGQAYHKLINDLGEMSTPPVKTTDTIEKVRKKILSIVQGSSCLITDDSIDLNCRSYPLSTAINPDGMLQIGKNTFKVDQDSVTLISGNLTKKSAENQFFFEHGYHEIAQKKKLKSVAAKASSFEALYLETKVTRGKYRVRLYVREYTAATTQDGQSYCEVSAVAQIRNWYLGYLLYTNVHVQTISIGGAFSGPHTPSTYYKPNPFNHAVAHNCMTYLQPHWKDADPFYPVFSCAYDCSVYYYDGYRLDANVWK